MDKVEANTVNLMKEEFVTARYLYFLAEESPDVYHPISKITNYIETHDYSDFGLRSGLFKASFRLAADCLDKIAVFINDYFELDHPVDFITFTNVWFLDRASKKGIHPKLSKASKTNPFLSAILDVKRDWYLQAMPAGRLRDIRNKTTHSKLILHWMYHDKQSQDLSLWNADDFQKVTMFMLRIAKASIMYTILAVDIEEGKRESTSNNSPKISMPVNINQGISDRSFDDEIE